MNTEHIKKNLKSGITVSLISIPLSVSLAVASGATPLIGIITAIWAGLVAAVFGGSNFNIVGPTGALSGVIATYVLANGMSGLPVLAILTGAIIIVAYLLKLERYLILIPSSVIHGFTLGVAFIIGLGQLNSAIGLTGLPVHSSLLENTIESLRHLGNLSWISTICFAIFLFCLFLFKRFLPKVPGAIILAPVGILIGYLSSISVLPFSLQTLGSKFGEISFHFVTALNAGELELVNNGESTFYAISRGFLEVGATKVSILSESIESAQDIDEAEAQEARERAKQLLKEKNIDEVKFADASAALERAIVRIKVAGRKKSRSHKQQRMS